MHVTSEMFPYLGICHVGVPPRVKFTYVYKLLYAIAEQLFEITMDSSEKERVPSIDELCTKIPILSENCRKLDDHVKRRYLEKIGGGWSGSGHYSRRFAELPGSGNEFLHQTAV